MPTDKDLEIFHEDHPYPDQMGVKKLFKFMSFDDQHPEYLEQLLVELRLFHNLPAEFNDPYECKPHWQWPSEIQGVVELRKYFFNLARKMGLSRKESEQAASRNMSNPQNTKETLLCLERILFETDIEDWIIDYKKGYISHILRTVLHTEHNSCALKD